MPKYLKPLLLTFLILIYFGNTSKACSCSPQTGFCELVNDDTTLLVLGTVVETVLVEVPVNYIDTTNLNGSNPRYWTGVVMEVNDVIRGSIQPDTITVWSGSEAWHDQCNVPLYHPIGDTILIAFLPDTFSVDSVEAYADYRHYSSICNTSSLKLIGDTLRSIGGGYIYGTWDYWWFQSTHPYVQYHSTHAAYSDFKSRIQNNQPCLNYVSIEDIPESKVSVYPNPTKDFLKLELERPFSEELKIDIFSLDGSKVRSVNMLPGQIQIQVNLQGLTNGLYIYTVKSGKSWLHSGKVELTTK